MAIYQPPTLEEIDMAVLSIISDQKERLKI